MPITTNNHIRDYLDISDVPESEIDEWNSECSLWVKYRGMYLALSDFGYNPYSEWSATYGLTNTASIVLKPIESDQYIIGLAT